MFEKNYNSIFKKKRKNTLFSLVQSPSPFEKSLPFQIIPQNPMMTDFTSTAVEACSFVFFIFHNFTDLSLAVLGLCCRLGFSSCGEQGLVSRGGAQASSAPASPVGEHRLWGIGALSSCGTWALQSP